MKKIFSVIFVLIISFMMVTFNMSFGTTNIEPVYDETFNNNKGIFYANGNDIVIAKDADSNTVVRWNGGTQIVPSTVTIVGGGTSGTSFEKSNIVMNDGEVGVIYGGGISLDENNISTVANSNVTINGGNVLATLYGGGLIYTNVQNANVIINDGTINALCGGGCASASINGVSYSAGVETDLEHSKNRVQNTNVVINGGIFDSTPSNYGTVFGGGQGYSYVENSKITINDGDLSKAYVTSGGSNGYTKNANVKISGGNINIFQTVNRGKIEKATLKMDGGNIIMAYVGGETDPSVTGIVDKIDISIINGKIDNLYPGTSGGEEIIVEQENYKVVYVDGTTQNSEIGGSEIKITYDLEILEDSIEIFENKSVKLNTLLTTNPAGYENLFAEKVIEWESSNAEVANVDAEGNVTGVKKGEATIKANLLEVEDLVDVKVVIDPIIPILIVIFIVIILLLIIIF